MQTLAVSNLLFGCVVYACLSDLSLNLTPCNRVWKEAEVQLRHMLRWAMVAPVNMRSSMLYVAGNCPTVQALVYKRCLRYFNSIETHPRFVTKFKHGLCSSIDATLVGPCSLYWWQDVCDQYMGSLVSVKVVYTSFRELLSADIVGSERIQRLGLATVVEDMLMHCLHGAPRAPP